MSLSEKAIDEFQEIYKKEYGKEISRAEASESAYKLVNLFKVLHESHIEDMQRKERLKKEPKGFQLTGVGYTCHICGDSTQANSNWYDKWGIKCLICQGAVDRKEIPGSLATHQDTWYSKLDLEISFNLKGPTLRKWIKNGIIKARTVTYNGKGVHTQLFLIKDNKDFLPPKELVKSEVVKETKDGKDWLRVEPWYRFFDPFERLRGYKIMEHMKVTQEEKKNEVVNQIKKTMKIKELFRIGGIMQSIDGRSEYLDQNNCVIENKTKKDDAVIIHLKRESDGEEGNVYLRVKDDFKEIKDQLLTWVFANKSIVGLTLNQLEGFDTNLSIEKLEDRLVLHQS